MRWQRAARVLGLVASAPFAAVVVHLATIAGCVDGTTPDCSDAATQCGPDLDGTTNDVLEAALPETSPPSDAAIDTSTSPDAEPDADLDAGDEG
jgi:hypothetical protein